jgi:uncharacterized membrane-anchored protein
MDNENAIVETTSPVVETNLADGMTQLPTIGFGYWMSMICATTFGEIFGNLISRDFGLGYSVGATLLIGLFVVTLVTTLVFRIRDPKVYWALILLGNIAGTDTADLVTRTLNLGNVYGSLCVLGALSAIFVAWHLVRPHTARNAGVATASEALYWLAILASSTFGTTFGDFLSSDTPLGSSGGTIVLLGLLAVTGLLVRFTRINRASCYWFALVVMHPVGATAGNFISKPEGWNLGNVWTSVTLALAFVLIYRAQQAARTVAGPGGGDLA